MLDNSPSLRIGKRHSDWSDSGIGHNEDLGFLANANALISGIRVALEAVRQRRAAERHISLLIQAALITRFLTEAGFGRFPLTRIRCIEEKLSELLEYEQGIDHIALTGSRLETLVLIVAEHER